MGNFTKVAIVDDVPPGQGLRVTVDDKSGCDIQCRWRVLRD